MSLTRREFFKASAIAGGGIAVGLSLTGCGFSGPYPGADQSDLRPNAYLQIKPDGVVVFQLPRSEMGQGVYTGLTTLVAEELNMLPEDIVVEHAYFHPEFRDPQIKMMMTGGSLSISHNYLSVRQAAANLRQWLVLAAAKQMELPAKDLHVEGGSVLASSGEAFAFAVLLETARGIQCPESADLKPAAEFSLIGKYGSRLDALAKVTGKAQFGIDCDVPDALTAVMVRCPHLGGRLMDFDDSDARKITGVDQIFEIDGAVAVVATGYWAARKAADALRINWNKGPLAGFDHKAYRAKHLDLLDSDGRTAVEVGKLDAGAGNVHVAEYYAPMQSHSPMEPPNAVARVEQNRVEIWTGTQAPDITIGLVASALDRPKEQVIVHNQFLGGGFGRRGLPNYAVEAAKIAERSGRAIKLIWSREDDIQHDYYRPAATVRFSAGLCDGAVKSLTAKVVVPSMTSTIAPIFAEALLPVWTPSAVPRSLGSLAKNADESMTDGLANTNYQFPYIKVESVLDDTPLPIGFWRSVGNSQNAFFMESFVDELAHQLGADPLAFRLANIPENSRRYRALKLAANLAGWGSAPEGQFQGLAAHDSFDTSVAQVVTVSVAEGKIRVHKVVCVVDCGLAVNPDIVRAQMESAVVFGMTAALKGQITLSDGCVEQSNFHDYPMLSLAETPEIDVHIVESSEAPSGVGEPGVPPVAPALANAVFAATGQRLRELPLRLS